MVDGLLSTAKASLVSEGRNSHSKLLTEIEGPMLLLYLHQRQSFSAFGLVSVLSCFLGFPVFDSSERFGMYSFENGFHIYF